MKDSSLGKSIIAGVFICLFGSAVGFGVSQTTIVAEVRQTSTEITHLRIADNRIEQEISENKKLNAEKMTQVISLFDSLMRQNQEFIQLLRVQNELLAKKGNQ